MKNIVKALFVVTISVVVYFLCNKKTEKEESILLNIEALADTEYGKPRCMGLGSVDCPSSSVKVLYLR